MAKTLLRLQQPGPGNNVYWDASSIAYLSKKNGKKKDFGGFRIPSPTAAESTEAIPASRAVKMEIPFGKTFGTVPAVVASISNWKNSTGGHGGYYLGRTNVVITEVTTSSITCYVCAGAIGGNAGGKCTLTILAVEPDTQDQITGRVIVLTLNGEWTARGETDMLWSGSGIWVKDIGIAQNTTLDQVPEGFAIQGASSTKETINSTGTSNLDPWNAGDSGQGMTYCKLPNWPKQFKNSLNPQVQTLTYGDRGSVSIGGMGDLSPIWFNDQADAIYNNNIRSVVRISNWNSAGPTVGMNVIAAGEVND